MAQRTYLQNKNRVTDVKKTSCGYQGGLGWGKGGVGVWG